jgi:glycosyltransferase involved in cell wall biosynthesis
MAGARKSTLSVAIITLNEEANLERTLKSISFADEIVIVDAGSSDRTAEIASAHNAQFFNAPWHGFGAQKNLALSKCTSDWLLSLDADEEVSPELANALQALLDSTPAHSAYTVSRRNLFLGRWMRRGGYYPDRKLRLIRRGSAFFEERAVHETMKFTGSTGTLVGDLVHHAYPNLHTYLDHMDRYSSLGAQVYLKKHPRMGAFSFVNGILLNPVATFLYNYILRLGFLDGREGLLLHLYHSCYVSWKHAKAWEISKQP